MVVQSMRQSPRHKEMQRLGCAALRNLAFNEETLGATKVVLGGGVEVILEAMLKFAEDARVQAIGCGALSNLAKERDDDEGAETIVNAEGIDTVVLAMKTHPRDADVQVAACECFYHLTDVYLNFLTESDAYEAITDAMRQFPFDQDVQRACIKVLTPSAERDEEVKESIRENGGVLALAKVRGVAHHLCWSCMVSINHNPYSLVCSFFRLTTFSVHAYPIFPMSA
jgi:hypothetical protein